METNCLVCPLLVPGSYAVLLYCVLDFSFHHTDDNTAAGFLIQDVSNFSVLHFFFSFFFNNHDENCSCLRQCVTFFFVVFRFRRTFYKTLKEEIQEVEAEHVSAESFTFLFFCELHRNLNWL